MPALRQRTAQTIECAPIRRAVAHPVADTISFPFPPCASPLFRRFLNAQALRLSPIIR